MVLSKILNKNIIVILAIGSLLSGCPKDRNPEEQDEQRNIAKQEFTLTELASPSAQPQPLSNEESLNQTNSSNSLELYNDEYRYIRVDNIEGKLYITSPNREPRLAYAGQRIRKEGTKFYVDDSSSAELYLGSDHPEGDEGKGTIILNPDSSLFIDELKRDRNGGRHTIFSTQGDITFRIRPLTHDTSKVIVKTEREINEGGLVASVRGTKFNISDFSHISNQGLEENSRGCYVALIEGKVDVHHKAGETVLENRDLIFLDIEGDLINNKEAILNNSSPDAILQIEYEGDTPNLTGVTSPLNRIRIEGDSININLDGSLKKDLSKYIIEESLNEPLSLDILVTTPFGEEKTYILYVDSNSVQILEASERIE